VRQHRLFKNQRQAKQNWLKMQDDKAGLVLRVETVANTCGEFRVCEHVLHNDRQRSPWVGLREGLPYLFREVTLQCRRARNCGSWPPLAAGSPAKPSWRSC